jgi:hypothetical protein
MTERILVVDDEEAIREIVSSAIFSNFESLPLHDPPALTFFAVTAFILALN